MSQGFQDFKGPNQFQPQVPEQKSSSGKTVIIILVVLFVVGGLICLGCCGGLYAMFSVGMNEVAGDIEAQISGDPTLREHIGEIESLSVNLIESASYDDDETFVYDVRGSKGSGKLVVNSITTFENGEDIQWAELQLDDGRTFTLDVY